MERGDPKAVLAQIEAERIETVRLCFVDQHGILRGKTLVADAIEGAFEQGVGLPATLLLKDTSHRTVFPIWDGDAGLGNLPLGGASDVFLRPDARWFVPLPWSPHSAILLCDVVDATGAEISVSSTAVLRRAVTALTAAGYRAVMGLEVEFQVFCVTDPGLAHAQATMPPAPPATENLTQGHQFLTETRYAEAEALLDQLRRQAQAMGLAPRTVEVEMGPSQFEFTFAPGDPETQAARYVLFRTMVKECCRAQGLHASFMAKPRLPNAAANGWHIHQSLIRVDDGQNVFVPVDGDLLTPEASGWIAGLLDHALSTCPMTNPTVNSYKRFTPYQLAPNRVLWGRDNRGAMVRALMRPGDPAARVENRVADASANPYFAFAAQIHAGLSGLAAGRTAPAPTETPYATDDALLPTDLGQALDRFEGCDWVRSAFGSEVQAYVLQLKRAEWERYLASISEWEHQEYFGLF